MQQANPIKRVSKSFPFLIFIIALILAFWSIIIQNKRQDVPPEVSLQIEIIDQSELRINQTSVRLENFSDFLVKKVLEFENQGISTDQIVCSITARCKTSVGSVSDIQQELRAVEIRKVTYNQESKM